jgi:hypothetical protein
MSYAYSAGELRDGSGVSVFQTAKQDAAKNVILNECYDSTGLQALGATPADFFHPDYVNIVGATCGVSFSPDCTNALAVTWRARWTEDRPAIDAMSAPILAHFGGMDTTVPTYRAACAKKKLTADLAAVSGATTTVQYCYNAKSSHNDTLRSVDVNYVNEWIAAKAGAGPEPAACTPFPANETCAQPPNDY